MSMNRFVDSDGRLIVDDDVADYIAECGGPAGETDTPATETLICTGCGTTTTRPPSGPIPLGWWHGDHADTVSGTVWHCFTCAVACQPKMSDLRPNEDCEGLDPDGGKA